MFVKDLLANHFVFDTPLLLWQVHPNLLHRHCHFHHPDTCAKRRQNVNEKQCFELNILFP